MSYDNWKLESPPEYEYERDEEEPEPEPSCSHGRIERFELHGRNVVDCLMCGHNWTEWPIHMDPHEYDTCLLLIAACLI